MDIKVSVIVPVYNVEKYLRECFDSILSQTLHEIEVVAINDGSPDNSLEILKEYEKKDNRVVVIDKINEGVGKARNDGIKKAAGEFIAFMDSDDFYPSDTVLETLYNAAKENNVNVAGGRKISLYQDGSKKEDDFSVTEKGLNFGKLGLCKYSDLQYDYGYTMYIYNRKMLIDNDVFFPPYKRFQDPPFFVKAMITADEYYCCDIFSYCYRMLPDVKKYSADKTLDFLSGLSDNLVISRKNNLPKLHYLSAMRLYEDASFMVTQSVFCENNMKLIYKMMQVVSLADVEWLIDEGFDVPCPFVPEVFGYLVSAAEKYEKLRNNKLLKIVSKFKK